MITNNIYKFQLLEIKVTNSMNDSIDIILEYLINLMILTCPSNHTSQFWKSFWTIKSYDYSTLMELGFPSDFTKKAELFKSLFIKYWTPINNGNILPFELFLKTDQFFSNATFAGVNMLKLLWKVDSKEAW